MDLPERVKFIPDRQTVEANKRDELTNDQIRFYFYKVNRPTLTIADSIDEFVLSGGPDFFFYHTKKGRVFFEGGFAEDRFINGCLLPGIHYRMYFLREANKDYPNFLSAEALEEPSWEHVRQVISRDLQKVFGFSAEDLAANRNGQFSPNQIIKMGEGRTICSQSFCSEHIEERRKLPFKFPAKKSFSLPLNMDLMAYFLPDGKYLLSIEPVCLDENLPTSRENASSVRYEEKQAAGVLIGVYIVAVSLLLTSLAIFGGLVLVYPDDGLCLSLPLALLGLFFLVYSMFFSRLSMYTREPKRITWRSC